MVDFESLDFETPLKKVREELDPFYVKHGFLHEMIREHYSKKDFDSETVRYLDGKLEILNVRMGTLQTIRDYLDNLENGVPFNINRRVGRYMVRFGLTEAQAKLLLDTYREHRKFMGEEDQGKYLIVAAQKVEWVEEEKCLHVHFEDTWWHYSVNGSWY